MPSYDVPIMPTLPVDHDVAFTSSLPVGVVNPFARPLSQSTTNFIGSALGIVADGRASLRAPGARRLGVHDGEAARHPLVDQRVRDA